MSTEIILDDAEVDELICGAKPDAPALIEVEVRAVERFYEKHASAIRPPEGIREWVENVYDLHEKLILRWGGWRWHGAKPVTTAAEVTANAKEMIANTAISRLWEAEGVGPGRDVRRPVMNNTAFDEKLYDGAYGKKVELYYDGIRLFKVRNGQSVMRAVLAKVRSDYADSPRIIEMWEWIGEQMGQLWGGRNRYLPTLSCAPSSFLRLGHYGESSCYRTGGEWEQSKINLTRIRNSIIALTYKVEDGAVVDTPKDGRARKDKVAGRAWGVAVPGEGMVLSNHYLLKGHRQVAVWTAVLGEALGIGGVVEGQSASYSPMMDGDVEPHAYLNDDEYVYGTEENLGVVEDLVCDEAKDGARRMRDNPAERRNCYNCGCDYGDEGNFCEGCGDTFCDDCMRSCTDCGDSRCANCNNWTSCDGCGGAVCDDCHTHCLGCDECFCGSCCDNRCTDCGDYFCGRCIGQCADCKDDLCRRCGKSCEHCGDTACSNCIEYSEVADANLCSTCSDDVQQEADAALPASNLE